MRAQLGASSSECVEVYLRKEYASRKHKNNGPKIGNKHQRINHKKTAVMQQVELTKQSLRIPSSSGSRFEDEYHQLWLQISEDQTHEEGGDQKKHEIYLSDRESTWLEKAKTRRAMQTTVSHILAKHTVAKEYLAAPPSLASLTTLKRPLKV